VLDLTPTLKIDPNSGRYPVNLPCAGPLSLTLILHLTPPQEKAAKEGRKVGAASADATPPLNVAAGAGAAGGPPPGLGGAPGAAVAASVPAPLGSRAGSGTSSVSGAPEVHVLSFLSVLPHALLGFASNDAHCGDVMCAMHRSSSRPPIIVASMGPSEHGREGLMVHLQCLMEAACICTSLGQ